MVIGNIYIQPNEIEQIHAFDLFLEDQRDKVIIIFWDFNTWNSFMGQTHQSKYENGYYTRRADSKTWFLCSHRFI